MRIIDICRDTQLGIRCEEFTQIFKKLIVAIRSFHKNLGIARFLNLTLEPLNFQFLLRLINRKVPVKRKFLTIKAA